MSKTVADSSLVQAGSAGADSRALASTVSAGVPVSTNSFPQRYLYAFAPLGEVQQHVRTQASPEDVSKLPEILQLWMDRQPEVHAVQSAEGGLAETIEVEEVPGHLCAKLATIGAEPLFQKTFARVRHGFAVVEIDKLIAAQRALNLDYVEKLKKDFAGELSMDQLVDICLSSAREMAPIQHLEIAPNVHVFSSPNTDIRFLGSYVKPVAEADLRFAEGGGLPAAAVIGFVGYGWGCVNVLKVNNRFVLNNGFHRVYALRSLGCTKIPVLVQEIRDFALEMPGIVGNLPREYILRALRPVLMKDFMKDEFTMVLRAKQRVRLVTLQTSANQHDVPA